MQYVDQLGRTISLGKRIGAGGEGTVYEVAGAEDLVAKIYKQAATPDKAAKLAAMAQLATPEILGFAAWPKSTLHQSRNSATIGIILPRIKNSKEIHELYSPAHRKLHFPRADWRFLVRAARNCAAAFTTLHDHKIIVGDVNQGNVFVSQQAKISLIDCDSFQVQVNGHLYRCPVGVAHFVPPELQNTRLTDIVRTFNHDNFGLAILIFHLLFMGRHPFSGRYAGSGDMPIEKAIREHRFAYSSIATRLQMAPPPNSPTLAALPQGIAILFERAFSKGSEIANARPSSLDWARALEQLEGQLRQCSDDPGHVYLSQLRSCPWCDVMRLGGPNFFIAVTIQAVVARSASFDLAGIWAQIQAIPRPDQVFCPASRVPANRIVPRPLTEGADDTRLVRRFAMVIAAISAALTLFAVLFPLFALLSIPVCVIFTVVWFILYADSPIGRLKHERRQAHGNKLQELNRAQTNQRAVAKRYLLQFQSKFDSLQQVKRTYEQLRTQRDDELRMLHQHVKQRQLDEFLRQFFISNAAISGIGPARIAALESYGIETAYDVSTHAVLNVPGFGEKMTGRLLNWRQEKEHSFRFNPSTGVPQADIQALEMKYAQKRSQCERVLQLATHELRQISNSAKAEVEKLDAIVASLEYEAAQTSADLRVVAGIPWWS